VAFLSKGRLAATWSFKKERSFFQFLSMRNIKKGTLKAILSQSGLTVEDFLK